MNKLTNTLLEWETRYNSAPANQPRPVHVDQGNAPPGNKNFKSCPELKPKTLSAELTPLELDYFIGQAKFWMKSSWN